MKLLNPLLKVDPEQRGLFQIIWWWEKRRLMYNLIVLFCGIISLLIMSALVKLPPGEDLQEPMAIVGFGLLCNVCYTLGWLTEIMGKKSTTYGPYMYKAGLYLTLFAVFLPMIIHITLWVQRGFTILDFT